MLRLDTEDTEESVRDNDEDGGEGTIITGLGAGLLGGTLTGGMGARIGGGGTGSDGGGGIGIDGGGGIGIDGDGGIGNDGDDGIGIVGSGGIGIDGGGTIGSDGGGKNGVVDVEMVGERSVRSPGLVAGEGLGRITDVSYDSSRPSYRETDRENGVG